MRYGIQSRRALRGVLAAAAVVTVFGSSEASAQRFQYTYGSNGCIETGLHGVKQLGLGGYVAVGESFQGPGGCMATSDAYVVVTNAAGAQVWSNTYQIGTNARATDVLELANGDLIVCGYTQMGMPCHANVSEDIFVLRLSAGGAILGTRTYGGDLSNEQAWKIIRAAVAGGGPSDYVIAGSSTNQNMGANRDGYLLRINAGLGIVWDQQYGFPNTDDFFFGVDEVPVVGDIVAAGGSNAPPANNMDIFVVRVNGANGAIGMPPQNASWTNYPGGNGTEVAQSVVVLHNGPDAGDIVVVGQTTSSPAPSEEVYMVEFGPDPCIQVADLYFGDNGLLPDRGYDLVEDANSPGGPGNVIVTGFTNVAGGFGLDDVFLQRVTTGGGLALLGVAGDYGDAGNERGHSIANARHFVANSETLGYIVNGFTASANLIPAGDTRQLYLIKTGVGLSSICNYVAIPFPSGVPEGAGTQCGQAPGPIINQWCQPPAVLLGWQWDNQLCYSWPKAPVGGGGGNAGAATLTFNEGSMISYPNPLRGGDPLNLRFEVNADAAAHISVRHTGTT